MLLAALIIATLIQTPAPRPPQPSAPSPPRCVRVSGGKVRPPPKIRDSKPDWAELAKIGVIRVVPLIFDAVIEPDGAVTNVEPLRSRRRARPDPRLERLYADAIRKWRFEPTTVDGQPVAVCMTVSVNIDVQ